MRGDVSHRKKLTEADVIVLKAISFDTENLGAFSEKDSATRAAVSEQRDTNVTQPVTVEVKAGRPLDFLGCGMALTDEVDKFDNGLLFNLFPKNQQESKKTTICAADQEQRYTKRQRVDDDGPIDHDLMAALGFGKNRQKGVNNSIIPTQIRKSAESDHEDPHHLTTVGDYLRSVTSLSASMKDANAVAMPSTVTVPQPIKVPSPMTVPSPMAMHSPNVTDRTPSMENQKSVMSLQKVTAFNSTPIMPKEICRDLKNLQKKAIESQIARGHYTVHLLVTSHHGDVITVGSRTYDARTSWVAIIGDSFASGEGNPDVPRHGEKEAQWIDDRCHRSSKSFASTVFSEIAAVTPTYLTFLACTGATIENGILEASKHASQLDTLDSIATKSVEDSKSSIDPVLVEIDVSVETASTTAPPSRAIFAAAFDSPVAKKKAKSVHS
uniref:PPM-type phosphatase domain-containing protein n=1 Tax=Angiostrongylus cantonensis TaxID=6313 RepID=A0A158P7K0_ANGCA